MATEVRQIEVDGRPVRHRVVGAGEPLVLVHGLAGSWRWWSPVLEALGAFRTLHVLDLPRRRRALGFAELSGWLARWLEAAGLERTDVAAHSLGGIVAAELAAREPDRVRRLALVAPAGIPCGRGLGRRSWALVDSLLEVRGFLPMVTADAATTGPLTLVRGISFATRSDLRAELPAVTAPTLLAWGERDRLVPARLADEWHRILPRARVVRLPCGHVPMLEAPGDLASCLLSFLEEELADDPRDEIRPRVVDGVRLGRHDHEPALR
jgi:pimeloyl-ACP methyl ester carboxylesterase